MNFVSKFARVLAPAAIVAAAAAAPAQTSGDLKAVEASLAATQSMTANFLQTDGKGRQMAGTLSLKRPGKIRFAYGGGVNMLLVADGKRLTFVDYDVAQKSSWPIARSPLAVLLSPQPDLTRSPGSFRARARMSSSSGPATPAARVRNAGAGLRPRWRRSWRAEAGRLDRDRRPEQENHRPPFEPALQCGGAGQRLHLCRAETQKSVANENG